MEVEEKEEQEEGPLVNLPFVQGGKGKEKEERGETDGRSLGFFSLFFLSPWIQSHFFLSGAISSFILHFFPSLSFGNRVKRSR